MGDKATIEKIDAIIVTPDNRIFGKKELDANKIVYQSEIFDYKSAAQNRDVTIPRSAFIMKKQIPVYPDSLCWYATSLIRTTNPWLKIFQSPGIRKLSGCGCELETGHRFLRMAHTLHDFVPRIKEACS